jgi:hypothetical protein
MASMATQAAKAGGSDEAIVIDDEEDQVDDDLLDADQRQDYREMVEDLGSFPVSMYMYMHTAFAYYNMHAYVSCILTQLADSISSSHRTR